MITPSSTNPKVTQVGDYIFRVCFIDPFQGFVMAKFARENLKLKKVAVLKDVKSDYSLGLSDVFSRKFTEMGGKIVRHRVVLEGRHRLPRAAHRAQGPEARGDLRARLLHRRRGDRAAGARARASRSPLLGGDGWDSEKLFELGGTAIEGSYFSNHYSPEDPVAPGAEVHRELQEGVRRRTPDSLAALGYDAANVAIDAMKRAPDLSGPALRDAIAQTKDFPGVGGNITLDENRNAVKPAVVLQVQDGKQKYVATIAP